jgi:hypothetical protein
MGQQAFSISDRNVPSILPISDAAIVRSQDCSLARSPGSELKKASIIYEAPAASYRKIHDDACFANAPEHAHHGEEDG